MPRIRGLWVGILFVAGRGAFQDGVQPGTIDLAGEELDWETCGACVRLFADGETDPKCYFATGGTLTVTSVEERLTGSLEDVSFQHVECENFSPPIDDGCGTSIERLWFDDEVVEIVQ